GRHRQHVRQAARGGHGVEARTGFVDGVAPGAEQHAVAVRRPAVYLVVEAPALRQRALAGIPGELHRLAAAGRDHVDLVVAAVLAGEGDPAAIGREARRLLDAGPGGEAGRRAALDGCGPEVT